MTIEQARLRTVRKPWGSSDDLRPWSAIHPDGEAIGELWFERVDSSAPDSALLLKLLFTTAPLSIQVHPDDDFAHGIGLAHGKTEAWYILSATPNAQIALGLTRVLTPVQLRAAILDGSIADLVSWRGVGKDEVVFVPAGTIHAIGGGLVVAEIQQRSDATFRLFDYGRQRELHVEQAVAVAIAGPVALQPASRWLSDVRQLLLSAGFFTLERIDLPARSSWALHAERESWMLGIAGDARVGPCDVAVGQAVFLDREHTIIEVGSDGVTALVAYEAAEPCADLLHDLGAAGADFSIRDLAAPVLFHRDVMNGACT